MSDYVHVTGILVPIPLVDGFVELTAKFLLEKHGYSTEKEEEDDSYEEMLMEEGEYNRYIFTKSGRVYELTNRVDKDPYDAVLEAFRGFEGTFNVAVRYHNGGCSIDEAIGMAIAPLELEEEQEPYLQVIKQVVERKYNPNYGDDRECVCGHPYYRHFDTYEDMDDVGCKYCGCTNFILNTNSLGG